MDWAAGSRWRKATVISALVHSIVLSGVGYFAGTAVLPAPIPETLIELELASDEQAGLPGLPMTDAPAVAPASQEVVPQLPQTTPAAETVAQEAIVAVSALAVVAVDSGTGTPAGATATGAIGAGEPGAGIAGGNLGSGESTGTAREVIPPGILSRREPNYPEKARQAGIEGTVVLNIEILENGHAGQVSIYQSSGSELLDDAAAAAVQRWRFVPAKVRGTNQSIACQTTLPVAFRLKA
jgi:protein TonB